MGIGAIASGETGVQEMYVDNKPESTENQNINKRTSFNHQHGENLTLNNKLS